MHILDTQTTLAWDKIRIVGAYTTKKDLHFREAGHVEGARISRHVELDAECGGCGGRNIGTRPDAAAAAAAAAADDDDDDDDDEEEEEEDEDDDEEEEDDDDDDDDDDDSDWLDKKWKKPC
nr:unnamed protein product [Spirometra erinaceieuropaei]